MKYEEIIILLPCHSLEDFPQHHDGEDAESLLASWTALWHPALLASARSTPNWYRSDSPPQTVSNRLIVVPTVCVRDLPTGYAQRVKEEGAHLIRKETVRQSIVTQALEALDGGSGLADPDLALDFMALGYAYLQVQLLTRQMRYASNLDEAHFRNLVVAAAESAVRGEPDSARDKLAACFHLLAEERDHYYSVDVYLLDLNLVAVTTLGDGLRNELRSGIPTSVLLTGELVQHIADTDPETLNALRNEVEARRVSIVGGEWTEAQSTLLCSESLVSSLIRGTKTFEHYLNARPEIYGRRRFGLGPALPLMLRNTGFKGVLNFTLDDGKHPITTQSKSRWEGVDGSVLDTLGRVPLDASKATTFLGLATKLGECMDSDHVATLTLAHWPNRSSPWYEDLKRVSRYCSALGKFTTIDQYFRDTHMPSHQDRYSADQYQSPFLKQAIIRKEANPISRWISYWRQIASEMNRETLATLATLIRGTSPKTEEAQPANTTSVPLEPNCTSGWWTTVQVVESANGEGLRFSSDPDTATLSDDNTELVDFSQALPRQTEPAARGCFVANTLSCSRRILIRFPGEQRAATFDKPALAAEVVKGEQQLAVELAPFGFAWLTPTAESPKSKRAAPPLAEDGILRNEFFEAVINSKTGSLQSIHVYNARGNRLSQQLAVRLESSTAGRPGDVWRDPDELANYSVMAADEVTVTQASSVMGEIVTRGRLLDKSGKVLARFRQTYQTHRGSRVLRLAIELEPLTELQADPWNSYIACRFAWADEAASLWRALNDSRQSAESKRFEAPLYIELDSADRRTAILTGGVPYHQRSGPRTLDSLLVVRGESARRFEFGMLVDSPIPLQEAWSLITPLNWRVESAATPAPSSSGWLFHIDAKNVFATSCRPLIESTRVVGICLRLHETAGRAISAKLTGFREFRSARQVDFLGQVLNDCVVEGGVVRMDLAANEWLQLEARWS